MCRDMLAVLVCWGILRKRHEINKTPEPAHSKQSQILKFKLDAYPGKNSTHCLAESSRNGLGEGARKVLISHHRTRLGRLRIPAISME